MMTCAITTSFLGCLATTYLFVRYALYLDFSCWQKALIWAAFLLVGCFPLLVSYSFESIFGRFYPYYRYSLYFLFVGAVILLTLTLVIDAAWIISKIAGYWQGQDVLLCRMSRRACLWMNAGVVFAAFLCTCWALHEGTKVPEVKQIEIAADNITKEQKIVVLSDIHIHRVINPDKVKGIIERTNAQNPDIILLAGDILDDDVKYVAETTTLLKQLKAQKGIYFVTGNHEFYAGYKPTVNILKQLGFTFLENGGVSLDDIYVAGIPDTFSGKDFGKIARIDKAFAAADKNQYKILMSHTPTEFAENKAFDLEISGHTHGGQIFPFHIFAKLHNQYLAGLYDMENGAKIYVSRGAGQWGPQMRFLAPAEISVITLKPLDDKKK